MSRPGLPPSDFPAHGGVGNGGIGGGNGVIVVLVVVMVVVVVLLVLVVFVDDEFARQCIAMNCNVLSTCNTSCMLIIIG